MRELQFRMGKGSFFAGGATAPPPPALGNGKGVALPFLGGDCGLLGDSCGCPELARGDADQALEVAGELALVREPGFHSPMAHAGPLRASARSRSSTTKPS
jgi:hypothetical protein